MNAKSDDLGIHQTALENLRAFYGNDFDSFRGDIASANRPQRVLLWMNDVELRAWRIVAAARGSYVKDFIEKVLRHALVDFVFADPLEDHREQSVRKSLDAETLAQLERLKEEAYGRS